MSRGGALAVAAAAGAVLAGIGCGTGFEVARLSEPAIATSADGLRVEARQLHLSDEIATDGLGHESEIVAELTLTNRGTRPYELRPISISMLMAVDSSAPWKTRSLSPSWAGEGAFADEEGDGGYHLKLHPIVVPPGQTRSYWIVFRGYRFPGSDVARRIMVRLPDGGGGQLALTLADPARGLQRWEVSPASSTWMLGVQNNMLFGDDLHANAVATQVTRMARAGRFRWDVGFGSRLLVQIDGKLQSSTSAFSGLGINGHLSAPFWFGGSPDSPREAGVYGGAELINLVAIDRPGTRPPDQLPPTYSGFAFEIGLELGLGGLRRAPTPFPLTQTGRPIPVLVTRIGYTHWELDAGSSDGYTAGFRLAW